MDKLKEKYPWRNGAPVLDVRENLFILTGAGISAESGLKTFRDNGGLWENHRLEDVATPKAFLRDPALVHRFYNARRQQLREVEPNKAHRALADLERRWEGEFTLVTQNVDDLHTRAGSRAPIPMHGELLKARCLHSGRIFDWAEPLDTALPCPCCRHAGGLRPHIVWFGEMPLHMEEIAKALERCDVFIAIGTSGVVYPAAGFAMEARQYGAFTLECNLQPSGSRLFHAELEGPASETVCALLENITPSGG